VARYISAEFIRHPDSPDLLLRAGGHFRSQGLQDTSFVLYKKVVDMAPEDPDGYRELAQYFLITRSYDSARYYAERAIMLDNGSVDSRLLKARALDRSYQYGESIDEYNEILRLDPDHAIAQQELTKLKNKIAYLRDIRRIREQKKDMNVIKIPETKKLKP
jgi:tetratricopeptide (TPR) repeat protein